jgi:DNA-binding beta-propeller fold protein YncE
LKGIAPALALFAAAAARAFGPGDPPPGLTEFSGGPLAVDVVHDRLFICDSANNRVLVYDFSGPGGALGSAPLAVLGQLDARSTALNGTDDVAPNGCGLAHPDGLAYDAARNGLWVSDFLNNRVLFFDMSQPRNFQPAEHVIGQTSFGAADARAGRRGLFGPAGLALSADGNQIAVADSLNNRVLIFDVRELRRYPAAVAVFGQEDFWGFEGGTSDCALSEPSGVALDVNGQLYVADTGNNRIVVFDANATAGGAKAYAVFGQRDFDSAEPAAGVAGLRGPVAIALDELEQWIFVADAENHRVVAYDGRSGNPLDAAAIIGQPGVDSCEPQPAAAGLDDPVGVAFDLVDRKLWVSETGNARVGFYRLAD